MTPKKKKVIKRYPVDLTGGEMYEYNSEYEAGLSLSRAYAAKSSKSSDTTGRTCSSCGGSGPASPGTS